MKKITDSIKFVLGLIAFIFVYLFVMLPFLIINKKELNKII